MQKILVALLVLLFPVNAMASVEIVSLLPNPAGKDEDGEYIEIQNIGCNDVDISGYTLADANGKPYSIPQGSILSHGQSRKFPHSETKIMLNNSGVEAVYLRDSFGNLIDEVQYTGTQKDDIPIILSVTIEHCEVPTINSGTTSSGLQIPDGDTGSGSIPPIITESGGVLDDSDRSLLLTGQVISDSGVTSSGTIDPSITSSSGNTHSGTSSDSGSIYTETGLLSPLFMYYADTNNNNHIDTLEIVYPYILMGSVNTGAIFLYSNTGGIYSHRINTETGYIIGASLSGNILILHLLEGDIDSMLLKINNTTTSAIRLKSSSDLGFRSIGGQIPEDFFLTKSFDEYRSVSPKIEVGVGNPETQGNGITDTPLSRDGSGTTLFPEIFLTYQNYTNTSNSGEVITCTTMPCRVNGTFEPIFTGGFLQKEYLCKITFASGVYDSCNPPQFYPTSSGAIYIQLIHKATGNSILKVFPVEFNILPTNSRGTPGILPPANNRAPIASIDMDGKWKKYFSSPEVNVIRCYTFSCSVNFTGENSYDPDGDVIRFLWIYDYSETSTKKDPGTRTFSIGNHMIILRVIDPYDAYGETKYTIEVMHPDLMPKEIEREEKKGKVASKKTSKKTAKKKKLKPIIFFDPPEIILQNKHPEKIKIIDNTYLCYSKTKKCSINFALTGVQKGYTYEWIFPNQSGSYISKNPKSFSFSIGSSTVRMVVRDLAGNTLSSQDMTVRVIKTTKTRIKKQPIKKQKKTTERISREENQKIENSLPSTKETDSRNHQTQTPLALLGFLSVTGVFGFIRTRRIGR